MRSLPLPLFFTLSCVAFGACVPEPKFPGGEVMGTFDFQAALEERRCALDDFADAFSFQGTFSRDPDGGQVFFTLGEVTREGAFDGQRVVTTHVAPRRFESCGCPDLTSLSERLDVALLSRAQNDVLENRCPAPDGGLPLDEDGGIRRPGSTPSGFDAVRACGTLTDTLLKAESCTCGDCEVRYRVMGVRR